MPTPCPFQHPLPQALPMQSRHAPPRPAAPVDEAGQSQPFPREPCLSPRVLEDEEARGDEDEGDGGEQEEGGRDVPAVLQHRVIIGVAVVQHQNGRHAHPARSQATQGGALEAAAASFWAHKRGKDGP